LISQIMLFMQGVWKNCTALKCALNWKFRKRFKNFMLAYRVFWYLYHKIILKSKFLSAQAGWVFLNHFKKKNGRFET
jgi:hypothetical protein